ncbi:MAG: ATP synthase F1 subunit delta [Patescibacteria group bacterium]
MKISVRQYAQGLFAATSGASEAEVKTALKNFVLILDRDRVLGKAAEIIACFREIWEKEHGELAAELTSARELGAAAKELIVAYLKNKTQAKKVQLTEIIDKSLIGGFILNYESRVIDGSLKSSLASLKNKISN